MKPDDDTKFVYDNQLSINYISRRYGRENMKKVKDFLEECINNHSTLGLTYLEVYELIEEELNLKIPN